MEHSDPLRNPEGEYSEKDVEIPEEFRDIYTRCLEEVKEVEELSGEEIDREDIASFTEAVADAVDMEEVAAAFLSFYTYICNVLDTGEAAVDGAGLLARLGLLEPEE